MKFSKIYRVMQKEPRLVVPSLPRFYSILGGRQYNGTVRWYGGKYFQLKDLLPYIGELAEHNKATTFIDCCGGSAKVWQGFEKRRGQSPHSEGQGIAHEPKAKSGIYLRPQLLPEPNCRGPWKVPCLRCI